MEDRTAAPLIVYAGPRAVVPARLETHVDLIATPCDECRADIPAATTSTLHCSHLPSCSLHPANGTLARRWNHHVTDRGGWCPWSLVSVSARLDVAQPCPAGCGNSHIVEQG